MPVHFKTTRRVEFRDTDMAGIMHFTCYYRLMEEVEHEFFRSLGLSIMQPQDDGSVLGWPRVSASCRFEAPAFFEDEIEIEVAINRIGVKSLTLDYTFRRGEQPLAHGTMKTVCCLCRPAQPMRSVAIPEDYLRRLQALLEPGTTAGDVEAKSEPAKAD